jgi:uncharacterized Tic20 family protein
MINEDTNNPWREIMGEVVEKRQELPALKPETTSEERTWSAIAHASTILTYLSGGVLIFIAFVIYLIYKDKSRYVAYQAAQAFAMQLAGTVGWLLAGLVLTIVFAVAIVISAILIVVGIGIILTPIVALLGAALYMVWTALPFAVAGVSIWATVETAGGKAFDYPYLGEWVADRLTNNGKSQPIEAPPAV